MRAGPRRHKITFERAVSTTNDYGEPIETWVSYADAWAEISPLVGTEQWRAAQLYGTATVVFRLNYVSGLDVKMRITWNGNVYNIYSIVNIEEKNRDILIYAEQAV